MNKAETGSRRQIAKVKSLATEQISGDDTAADIDKAILARIQKCLDRAQHPNTPEAEAKAALRLSSRLMDQYNVTQADMVAAECATSQPSKLSGQSIVSIIHNDESKKIIFESWVNDVMDAMETFFDCKSYSTQHVKSLDIAFYGIATNTVAAAISFEMVHNLIQDWSMKIKKGNKNSYRLGVADGLHETAVAEKENEERRARKREAAELAIRVRNERDQRQKELERLSSGEIPTDVVDNDGSLEVHAEPVSKHSTGTNSDNAAYVKIEDDLEEAQVHKIIHVDDIGQSYDSEIDAAHSQATVNDGEDDYDSDQIHGYTLHFGTNFDISDSDSEIDSVDEKPTFKAEEELPVDLTAEFDDELHRQIEHSIKQKKKMIDPDAPIDPELASIPAYTEPPEEDKTSRLTPWKSAGALILFRQNAQKIADDYLKARNMKLSAARQRERKIRDWSAFRNGVADSKKIDVKRRRIEN